MSNFQKILDSFSVQKTLNPKIWENPAEPSEAEIKPKVRKALMRIAEEFIDNLGEDIFVEDIVLTGSLSNFNWSEYSDFDLHVLIDMERYGKEKDLYKELFDLKKQVFNEKHDIKIYGYDVELYAQDTDEAHYSTGVYSIMNNEWVSEPKKMKVDVDKDLLKTKIKCWTDKIDHAIETSTTKDDKELLDKVKDKLKEYRKSGLEKEGELSYENLVFKFLRRSGHIEKLFDMVNKIVDKDLSVETMIKEEFENKTPLDVVVNSKFLSSLMKEVDNQVKYEYTPGQKIPYEPGVELIQSGLQLLGFSLPKWGVDGKFGPETEDATKKFQESIGTTQTGSMGVEDIKYLIGTLVLKGFKEEDLNKLQKTPDYIRLGSTLKSNANFRDFVEVIIDNLEGGYYHPDMKSKNPGKFEVMGKSGETMFGMDRKWGNQESTSAGQKFWSLIDDANAKNNWNYGYMLEDNPNLKDQLVDLIVQIEEPLFYEFSNKYLSDKAKSIVMSDPKLAFNFAYATYNGPLWFQSFAKKFNDKVDEGVTDVQELRDYALQIRREGSHPLIRRSADKIERIFNAMP